MEKFNKFIKDEMVRLDLEFRIKLKNTGNLRLDIKDMELDDLKQNEFNLWYSMVSFLAENKMLNHYEIEFIRKEDYFLG